MSIKTGPDFKVLSKHQSKNRTIYELCVLVNGFRFPMRWYQQTECIKSIPLSPLDIIPRNFNAKKRSENMKCYRKSDFLCFRTFNSHFGTQFSLIKYFRSCYIYCVIPGHGEFFSRRKFNAYNLRSTFFFYSSSLNGEKIRYAE